MLEAERYQRAKAIFFDACDQPACDRAAFVKSACAGDEDLRAAVLQLLDDDAQPLNGIGNGLGSSGLRGHLERLAGSTNSPQESVVPLPARIGKYRVISRLGEGGMGIVYLAEQENPRRQVALKVIASGAASRQTLRRFEHEAQILGRLHHPGIAAVYEAGMHDSGEGGQPFFAMELVRGRTLLRYCDETKADVRERLRLFIAICEAVQHAHQQGVIHRDLKPANILVEERDGETKRLRDEVHGNDDSPHLAASSLRLSVSSSLPNAQPKILDFGVARLIDSDVQATTMHTAADQLIGTVAYMSPEQMAGRADEIDTRSDVFALGVILFELLAGRLPHDVTGKTIPDMIRTISEGEPSTLSSIDRTYRGDLETIAGKAMERDRSRRYQSAGELAADVRRFLNDEPIHARPPTTMYQVRKFARRNRALVAGAAAVFLALVAGIVATTWQARQAIAARDEQIGLRREADENAARAIAEAEKATAVSDFLRRMLASANPDVTQGRDVLVGEVLDAAARELEEGALSAQPDVQAQVYMTIGATYQSIGRLEPARQHFERALSLARREPGRRPQEEAAAMAAVGVADSIEGDFTKAIERTQEALQVLRGAFGDVDREDIAECLGSLSEYNSSIARQGDAIALQREALAMLTRLNGEDDLEIAQVQARLASMLHDPGEAEPLVRGALATFEKQHGETHPSYVAALRTLADMITMRGAFDEAEPLYRRALELGTKVYGRDHHRNLLTLENLGFCLRLARKPTAFSEVCDELIRMTRQLYDGENMRIVEALIERADVRSFLGQPQESETDYREAAAMADRLGMQADSRACAARLSVAMLVIERGGDLSEARDLAESVTGLADQFRGEQKWLTGQAQSMLGEIALLNGDLREAERLCLQGFESLGSGGLVRNQRHIAAHRLALIYAALDAAYPGAGHAAELEKWRRCKAELAPPGVTPGATTLPDATESHR